MSCKFCAQKICLKCAMMIQPIKTAEFKQELKDRDIYDLFTQDIKLMSEEDRCRYTCIACQRQPLLTRKVRFITVYYSLELIRGV